MVSLESGRPHQPASSTMLARHAVLLNTSAADVCFPPATRPESTLVEVFILGSLNPFRMNTFCKLPCFAQFWCNLNPFRINTSKSASKQTALSTFRINTYEKKGGGSPQTVNSPFTEFLYLLNLLNTRYLSQKRQRPFRSDGGICEKGAPSSGEKIVCSGFSFLREAAEVLRA